MVALAFDLFWESRHIDVDKQVGNLGHVLRHVAFDLIQVDLLKCETAARVLVLLSLVFVSDFAIYVGLASDKGVVIFIVEVKQVITIDKIVAINPELVGNFCKFRRGLSCLRCQLRSLILLKMQRHQDSAQES